MSLSSHIVAPSIRQSPLPHRLAYKQTQLAIMMTNQHKYLCPSSFTLALPTARSLCVGHCASSQNIVIALHKQPSGPVMSPKHQWLLMSAVNQVYSRQRSGINIEAYGVLIQVLVLARWPTCFVNVLCVISSNRNCLFVAETKHEFEVMEDLFGLKVTCWKWKLSYHKLPDILLAGTTWSWEVN